jgi:hypothetical protein
MPILPSGLLFSEKCKAGYEGKMERPICRSRPNPYRWRLPQADDKAERTLDTWTVHGDYRGA